MSVGAVLLAGIVDALRTWGPAAAGLAGLGMLVLHARKHWNEWRDKQPKLLITLDWQRETRGRERPWVYVAKIRNLGNEKVLVESVDFRIDATFQTPLHGVRMARLVAWARQLPHVHDVPTYNTAGDVRPTPIEPGATLLIESDMSATYITDVLRECTLGPPAWFICKVRLFGGPTITKRDERLVKF